MPSVRQRRGVERSLKQRELFKLYPDPARLLVDYSPALQVNIVKSGLTLAEISKKDIIPTLGLLSGTYGEETPLEWLRIQIGSLNDYAEQGRGITPAQLSELCSLILSEYYYLNLGEFCMFIARFKLGYYGDFFGAIGPMKIVNSLRDFMRERISDIERYEREEKRMLDERMREEWQKTAISQEEYLRQREKRSSDE